MRCGVARWSEFLCRGSATAANMPHNWAMTVPNPQPAPDTARGGITTDALLQVALALTGPERSVQSLSLREIARAANIAPNSFYRHFRDTDELSVAMIERAGAVLRKIIGDARQEGSVSDNIARSSVTIFMQQLDAEPNEAWLPLLLREGSVGSQALKASVDNQLQFFSAELHSDLVKLAALEGNRIIQPKAVAEAITRLVFAMGTKALNSPLEQRRKIIRETVVMVRILIRGAVLAS